MRDVPWGDIFKLTDSVAASEICEWVQVGIDVYIPHCKYQVKPHSSPWISAACAAAIAHRNYFFCLYNNKSSESKVKFRQASNRYRGVLEAAKCYLHMLLEQKTPSPPTNVALGTFGKLLIAFSTNVSLLYLLYSTVILLSMVCKVFEKLVNSSIVDHLEKCGIFSDFQYGFRSSRSTTDLLTIVSDRTARAFNRSGVTRVVALDISKAFERVWHAGLLHKLKSYGVSGEIFGLISSFLSIRWFRVVLYGKSS